MFNEKSEALRLLNHGIKKEESLARSVLILAKYFKSLGNSRLETRTDIISWLSKYGLRINFMLNPKIDYIYDFGTELVDSVSIPITLNDMIAVNDRFDGKSIKLIAFAMICVSKMKAEPDGNFRCNLSSIAIWCGMSIRYLMNIIREVEDYDFVRAISKDKTSVNLKDRDGGKYKRISEPNIYKLIHDSGNEVIYTITDDSDINREFAKIYKLCIDKYGFKCNTKVKSFLLEELE